VPVAPFPPPPANNLSALPQNFCLQPPDGGQPARTIRTIVRNVGPVPAAASTTRVEFFPAGSNVPVASPTQPTPMLGPGGDVSHDFEIPQGCYLGESSCNFRITVDAMGAVDESNEGNNVVESFCPGVVS
jgi:hypothetical protein